MHTQGADVAATQSRVCIIFLIIEWSGVNYSAYTMVITPQHIDQIINTCYLTHFIVAGLRHILSLHFTVLIHFDEY